MALELEKRIDKFVADLLRPYKPVPIRAKKSIHDPIAGTVTLEKHELVLLDSPLLQRLRYIHQTGPAFFVYPSATHTRFGHTLGVVARAHRVIESILATERVTITSEPITGDLAHVRLAALLHDCGHGFMSHTSESIYRWDEDIVALSDEDTFANVKPHEMIAYFIVRSNAFQEFVAKHMISEAQATDLSLDRIAHMIIGQPLQEDRAFLYHIVNGICDADKLDYIARDGYFGGLPLTVDLERLFQILTIYHDTARNTTDIALTRSAPLEQILFSKMLLHYFLYHHPKVEACDCVIHNLIEHIRTNDLRLNSLGMVDPVDFLRLADYSLLAESASVIDRSGKEEPQGTRLLRCLRNRVLPIRALTVSRETVNDVAKTIGFLNFAKLSESDSDPGVILKKLRELILKKLPKGKKCALSEIHIAVPKTPSFREAIQSYILGSDGKAFPLGDSFVNGWLENYSVNQWKAYVYGPPGLQKEVHKAARSVFTDEYGLNLNSNSSSSCHFKCSCCSQPTPN